MSIYSSIFDSIRSKGIHKTEFIDMDRIRREAEQQQYTNNMFSNAPVNLKFIDKNLDSFVSNYMNQNNKSKGKYTKNELESLVKTFRFELGSKYDMHLELHKLRNNPVIATVIDVLIDDGINSSNRSDIFNANIKPKDPETSEELISTVDLIIKDMVNKVKLNENVSDFVDDIILHGDYCMPFEHQDGIGVTKIKDNPYIADMLPLYEGQELTGFLRLKNFGITEELPADSHIHFSYDYKRVRVEVKEFISNNIKFLDQHIKVGRSMFLPVINQLKQLDLIEMVNLALDLKNIVKPDVFQIQTPEDTKISDLKEIASEYEEIFGNMFDVLDLNEMSFDSILGAVGQYKFIPVVGQMKGNITQITGDYKESNYDKVEMIRKSVALLLGIPFYYLSLQGESIISRLESLKLFSRYTRKLNSLQACLIKGIKRLISIHLKDLGYNFTEDEINVTMRQIVNIELLDSLEFVITVISALQDILQLLNDIEELGKGNIELMYENIVDLINTLLSQIPDSKQLIKLKTQDEKENAINTVKDIKNTLTNNLKDKTQDIQNTINNNFKGGLRTWEKFNRKGR